MNSIILDSEKVENAKRRKDEGPSLFRAVFVASDGNKYPLLLTDLQIGSAMERGALGE